MKISKKSLYELIDKSTKDLDNYDCCKHAVREHCKYLKRIIKEVIK